MKRLLILLEVFLMTSGIISTLSGGEVGAGIDQIAPTDARSAMEFVTPDGRFDLEAARKSGYQGTLDLEGVTVTIDPVTGDPLLSTPDSQSPGTDPDDVYWDNTKGPGETVAASIARFMAITISRTSCLKVTIEEDK